MKILIIVLSTLMYVLSNINLYGQPYFDTYVKNKYVEENSFIKSTPDTLTPPEFNIIKSKLPEPVWPNNPNVINMYWRTWELAFNNIRKVTGEKGFIAPYIDPAFNNNIFTEDCGFMVLFCRYGSRAFNFQQTLDNFYAKQHKDGFICREIRGDNGNDAFQRFDPSSAGINIFPWAEWEYFCNFNDVDRLKRVFPVLLANYQWYNVYRSWPDGSYFSSGWGCGMDNLPRLPKGYHHAFSHGHMSWIDATLQEIFAGKLLIQMAQILDRTEDVEEIKKEVTYLSTYVNSKMWNSNEAIYVDRFRDGSLSNVKMIGTFWALLANVVPEIELPRFLAHLSDTTEFNRPHRIPTLSADNPDYDPVGGYWLGAVWAMTNYSVLRGLTKIGADSLAFEIATNHVNNVSKVFDKTGIIWENYSPEFQSGNNKKNFVGEGGLTGTAIFFEYIFGIRPDVPNQTVIWDIRLTDEFGVNRYPYGKNGIISFHCKKRSNTKDEPQIKIKSNTQFKLKIIWEGGSKTLAIKASN
ncbi:MAG TPA: trehalase family glycosidase [Bacteroidales bacterium]|nr:trehalase family glycosidase [Bacteroidales bacterium]